MKKIFACSVFLVTLLSALCPMLIFPGVPGKMNYQGKLTDSQGDLITGTKDIDFALYTDAVSTFAVWTESHASIQVTNGLFNVMLGETNDLSSAFETYDSLYLEIGVGGETLLPRQEMASTGYALKAQSTYKETEYPMETFVVKAGGTPGVDCDFTTVSDALGNDRSIFIKNGTYTENLIFPSLQNLIIRGESHSVIIRNNGAANTITLEGECINVLIRDLRIEIGDTGYSAIYIDSGDCWNITISNCYILSTAGGAANGISTADCLSSSTITDNYLQSDLHLGNGIDNLISNSLFHGNRLMNWNKGFSVNGSYNVFDSNYILSAGGAGTEGIHIPHGSDNVISNNIVRSAATGISIENGSKNVISNNQLESIEDYGIIVTGGSWQTSMTGNRMNVGFSGGTDVGIYAGGTGGQAEISGNHIRVDNDYSKGVYIGGTGSAALVGNWIYTPGATGAIAIEVDGNYNLIAANRNLAYEPGSNMLKETSGISNKYEANWSNDTS